MKTIFAQMTFPLIQLSNYSKGQKLFLFLMLVGVVTSCKKDDDTGFPTNSDITHYRVSINAVDDSGSAIEGSQMVDSCYGNYFAVPGTFFTTTTPGISRGLGVNLVEYIGAHWYEMDIGSATTSNCLNLYYTKRMVSALDTTFLVDNNNSYYFDHYIIASIVQSEAKSPSALEDKYKSIHVKIVRLDDNVITFDSTTTTKSGITILVSYKNK